MKLKTLVSLILSLTLAGATAMLALASSGQSAKLPADFPKDVPIYKNSTVTSYGPLIPGNTQAGNVLILETSDAKADVLAFYKKELPANGWKMEKPYSGSPDALQGRKGERMISFAVTESHFGPKQVTKIQIGLMGQ